MLKRGHCDPPFPLNRTRRQGALRAMNCVWVSLARRSKHFFLLFIPPFLYSEHNRKKLSFEALLTNVSIQGPWNTRAVRQEKFLCRDSSTERVGNSLQSGTQSYFESGKVLVSLDEYRVRDPQSRRTNPDLSRLGSLDLPGGGGILSCRLAPSAAPRFHVRKHGGRFVRAETQIGHPGVLVLLEERDRDRIALGEQLVRSDDVTAKPGPIPPRGHACEVRSHLVALPDSVADAALALKEVFPLVEHERARLRVALFWRRILPAQKIRYRSGEELRVVHGRVAHPQSPWFIADHEAGGVAVLPDRVAHPG